MPGPLSHIRVLDLSRVLAGPWCTQNLADLGAEVIKVEKPGTGDDTRAWGPPYLKDGEGRDTGESAYYLSANRGKKSVTVDIAKSEGQRIVRLLARGCDVLVENYKVGGLVKYGLDYHDISRENRCLVYCSITGFGQDGPYAARAGYDFMIQGMGGLMSLTGERDDRPGGGPQKVGVAVADLMTGMYATVSILAALAHRDRTGHGQHIDLSLLDCQVAMLANQNMNYLTTGAAPSRQGNAHPNIVPYQAFATADGHLILAVGNDGQFRRFCELAGCPALADDARFASNRQRVGHREALIPLLEPVLRQRRTREWIGLLEPAGVPCGPINRLDEVFDDAQVRHRGLRIDVPHPAAGTVPLVASPMRFSATPVDHDRPPPLLGEHTEEVLRERLGMNPGEIARLRGQGVI
ncbi:MAG: CoA transferase [Rhodocyclaceae bacterium]|jgi:crotonobetainyl-CoA:carnitine CoA-transferase CaiB-like acyl-CoA transferase|nr:CoA transferase [Rhodocyclaceae bacterium]